MLALGSSHLGSDRGNTINAPTASSDRPSEASSGSTSLRSQRPSGIIGHRLFHGRYVGRCLADNDLGFPGGAADQAIGRIMKLAAAHGLDSHGYANDSVMAE